MIRLLLADLIILINASGYGFYLKKKINFPFLFSLPFGFALFMALLEIGYTPAMLFNLSSDYEHLVTFLIIIIGLFLFIKNINYLKEYKRKEIFLIILSFSLFLFVYYHCGIDIAHSDAQMYLGYMSGNINTKHVSVFDLWTGETGKEWDTIYLFQGYYHFGASLAYFVNIDHYLLNSPLALENIVIETWGLSILYSIISSLWLLNFVDSFKLNKKSFYLVAAFALFYLNFFYWRVALSFYGNTFRTITSSALIFTLYNSFKNKKDYSLLCIILSFSGIAFSSSYLFISFSIYYSLMYYTFKTKKYGSIAYMAKLVLPLIYYILCLFYKDRFNLFIILLPLIVIYYLIQNKQFFINIIKPIEEFLHKYHKIIFLYGAFLMLSIGGAIYCLINPDYQYTFSSFFENHQTYDMIKDFFFVYTGKSQNLVNILRWAGLIVYFKKKDCNDFLKNLFIVLFIVFLNPFVVTGIAKLFASNVYYRTFDALFNPYTESLFLALLLKTFKHKYFKIIACIFVFYMLIYAHGVSWINEYSGEYGFYVHEDVLPKYKISNNTYTVLKEFQKDYVKNQSLKQTRVISQAHGLRTFEPDIFVLFTPYQDYYPNTRINEEFYQQSRMHYSYGTYYETDFSSACAYMKRFDVSYSIIDYNTNPDYAIEVAKCSDILYENDDFILYRYN